MAILLEIPMPQEKFCGIVEEAVRRSGLTEAYMRALVTRGFGDLGLDPNKCPLATVIIIAVEWGAMYGDLYEVGLTAISVAVRRNSPDSLPPNIKSLNYLNNILAKIEANIKREAMRPSSSIREDCFPREAETTFSSLKVERSTHLIPSTISKA